MGVFATATVFFTIAAGIVVVAVTFGFVVVDAGAGAGDLVVGRGLNDPFPGFAPVVPLLEPIDLGTPKISRLWTNCMGWGLASGWLGLMRLRA